MLPHKNVVDLVFIAVPSASSRCLWRGPSHYVCWFVLKERVYQFQVVNTGKVQQMSSVCVHLSRTILSNYCLLDFVFDCATGFHIEITSSYYEVSVANVPENAVKFGIKVFSAFMIFFTSVYCRCIYT